MGYTALELLIVAALLAVAAVVYLLGQPMPVSRHARDLARRIVVTRATSISSGRASVCLDRVALGDLVVASPARGLAFTPDGLPRTCDGGGIGNTTILLEHRGRQAAVIVSSLGRVRWEMR
jgi:hypothetical protein